jgi:hypothetical protein
MDEMSVKIPHSQQTRRRMLASRKVLKSLLSISVCDIARMLLAFLYPLLEALR